MDDLWKQVLAEIQIEVSKPTFAMFLKQTRLASFENSVATVSAPTFMIAETIEKKYQALIKSILDKKTSQNVSVVFTSSPGAKNTTNLADEGPLFTRPEPPKTTLLRVKSENKFETLAVSDSNQLAYTASLAVARDPGKKYNPLFIYGTVGVGKTHLMHSIANKVLEDNPRAKILYMTTEEFTNEVVESIRDKSTQNLRKRFRHADLLLLDDVQFLTGKDKVQEELFHTFNALVDGGGQMVLSSDRQPSELKKIEARLASRFEGGLTVDIQPPDFELRTAILLIKSKKINIPLTTDLAKIAAEKIEDTRALEGFLLRVATHLASSTNQELTPLVIVSLLGKEKRKTFLRPDSIIETICSFYNVKSTQLKGVRRDAVFVRPRHICMYLLKEEARLSLNEIGNLLGGRDHTTVMNGVKNVEKSLLTNDRTIEEVLKIKEWLSGEVV